MNRRQLGKRTRRPYAGRRLAVRGTAQYRCRGVGTPNGVLPALPTTVGIAVIHYLPSTSLLSFPLRQDADLPHPQDRASSGAASCLAPLGGEGEPAHLIMSVERLASVCWQQDSNRAC